MDKNENGRKECQGRKWLMLALIAFVVLLLLLLRKCCFSYQDNTMDIKEVGITGDATSEKDSADTEEQTVISTEQGTTADITIYEDNNEPIASTEAQVRKTTEEIAITGATEYTVTEMEMSSQATEDSRTTTQEDTQHVHNFVTNIIYISHAEEGHYEDVCVSQGYEEKIYETYDSYCYQCGAVMDDWSFDQLLDHSAIHGSYGTYTAVVEIIWHEPVYENQWIVDKEAYEEEVREEKCVECGYVK